MGRDFLLADLRINGNAVGVGTVHLESLSNARLRQVQLTTIADTMKEYDHWTVMGDFNFDSQINYGHADPPLENDVMREILPPTTIDTWLYIHKDKSSGKTYDSDINKTIHKYERMRYDRVMLQSTSNNKHPGFWVPTQARLIGTEPVEPGADVWPSDHFGVFVELEFSKE